MIFFIQDMDLPGIRGMGLLLIWLRLLLWVRRRFIG